MHLCLLGPCIMLLLALQKSCFKQIRNSKLFRQYLLCIWSYEDFFILLFWNLLKFMLVNWRTFCKEHQRTARQRTGQRMAKNGGKNGKEQQRTGQMGQRTEQWTTKNGKEQQRMGNIGKEWQRIQFGPKSSLDKYIEFKMINCHSNWNLCSSSFGTSH